MKDIFLIRHAKSSWDDPSLSDRERPLCERGERDARAMAERLAQRKMRAELILSSPAKRALATARIIGQVLGYKHTDVVVDDRLYAAAADDLLNVVRGLGDKYESVMLFGHNPGLSDLAHRLSARITEMPTCAVAAFSFDAKSWSQIGELEPLKSSISSPKKP
jgi:phosphohistidine phosphatase